MRRMIALALAFATAPAADEIYKCQAPGGNVIFSDQPCPGRRMEAIDVKPNIMDMSEFRQRLDAREQEKQKAQAEQAIAAAPRPPPGIGKTRACLQAKAALRADKNADSPAHYALDARERMFCSLRGEPVPGCYAAMEQFSETIQAGANARTIAPALQNIDDACGHPLPPVPEPRHQPAQPKPKSACADNGQPCPDGTHPAGENTVPPLKFCIDADGHLECQ